MTEIQEKLRKAFSKLETENVFTILIKRFLIQTDIK
jgi:hypothetical protein